MININNMEMKETVADALNRIGSNRRWRNAVAKAEKQIENNPFMHYDADAAQLLILSDSGSIYEVNGNCQCLAYRSGNPCWHRAAWRLLMRYSRKAPNNYH